MIKRKLKKADILIHDIYYCSTCNAAVKDEIECLVCGRTQLKIGWVEIIETGSKE
jgi:hypothetical protein